MINCPVLSFDTFGCDTYSYILIYSRWIHSWRDLPPSLHVYIDIFGMRACFRGDCVQIWRQFETIEMKLTSMATQRERKWKWKWNAKNGWKAFISFVFLSFARADLSSWQKRTKQAAATWQHHSTANKHVEDRRKNVIPFISHDSCYNLLMPKRRKQNKWARKKRNLEEHVQKVNEIHQILTQSQC